MRVAPSQEKGRLPQGTSKRHGAATRRVGLLADEFIADEKQKHGPHDTDRKSHKVVTLDKLTDADDAGDPQRNVHRRKNERRTQRVTHVAARCGVNDEKVLCADGCGVSEAESKALSEGRNHAGLLAVG